MPKKIIEKTKQSSSFMRSKFKEHSSTAIIAALSFIIAFAWKDLIVKLIQENIHLETLQAVPYLPELLTAITVTLIAIIGIAMVSHWAQKPEEK
jgi:hypothetical protein